MQSGIPGPPYTFKIGSVSYNNKGLRETKEIIHRNISNLRDQMKEWSRFHVEQLRNHWEQPLEHGITETIHFLRHPIDYSKQPGMPSVNEIGGIIKSLDEAQRNNSNLNVRIALLQVQEASNKMYAYREKLLKANNLKNLGQIVSAGDFAVSALTFVRDGSIFIEKVAITILTAGTASYLVVGAGAVAKVGVDQGMNLITKMSASQFLDEEVDFSGVAIEWILETILEGFADILHFKLKKGLKALDSDPLLKNVYKQYMKRVIEHSGFIKAFATAVLKGSATSIKVAILNIIKRYKEAPGDRPDWDEVLEEVKKELWSSKTFKELAFNIGAELLGEVFHEHDEKLLKKLNIPKYYDMK